MIYDSGASLKTRVFASLNNAIDNGFDVRSWTPDFLTDDLMSYDADLEGCDRASVLAAVTEWLAERPASNAQGD